MLVECDQVQVTTGCCSLFITDFSDQNDQSHWEVACLFPEEIIMAQASRPQIISLDGASRPQNGTGTRRQSKIEADFNRQPQTQVKDGEDWWRLVKVNGWRWKTKWFGKMILPEATQQRFKLVMCTVTWGVLGRRWSFHQQNSSRTWTQQVESKDRITPHVSHC